jgi:spore coat protein I
MRLANETGGRTVNEKSIDVLQQYDQDIIRTVRVRGAILCETRQGTRLLQEYRGSESHLQQVQEILQKLEEISGIPLDQIIKNKEEKAISLDEEGTPYIVKEWNSGRECNLMNESEVIQAITLLARLHLGLRRMDGSFFKEAEDIREEFDRHTAELKRARNYVKKVRHKSEFEMELIHSFTLFYEQAEEAVRQLASYGQEAGNKYLCHGEFSQHHILFDGDFVMVTDFMKMEQNIQAADLYYFMRKTLEKQEFQEGLGEQMMEAYDKILPLTRQDRQYLYVRFLYPEKYWKQVNYYYNSNKAWVPPKNTEKIRALEKQEPERKRFLERLEKLCED